MEQRFDLPLLSLNQQSRPIMNRLERYAPQNLMMTITVISTARNRVRGGMMS